MDVPLQTATVTQHDRHEVACGCGRVHRAPAPPGAGAGTVAYGLSLQAWCVYLIAAHAIQVHRCAELIEALTGAEPSPGFVHSMIARAAAAVAQANKAIRALIILAHVISADETSLDHLTVILGQRLTQTSPVMGSAVAHRNGSLQSRKNKTDAGILEDENDGYGGA